ncbi:MAG: hypothetical protein KDA73_00960 [Rhodobacteraceae bacterium]|nr:hypothetical protein [Paracoccaceae bacterium]
MACNAAGQATGFEFDANVDYPNHAAYCAAHAVYDAVSGAAGFDSGVGISATYAAHLTADAAERAARIGSTEAPDSNSGLSARTVYLALSRDAERIEAGEAAGTMFRHPVWRDVGEPTAVADARGKLLAFLDADPELWGFWRRWYQGMFDGRPMDWDLQRAVALIPDAIWQRGPEAVAAEIAQIEAEFAPEPLDQDALRGHLERLAAAPELHADAAESVAVLIETAIARYCDEVPANGLPDGFAPFGELPRVFNAIAATLRRSSAEAEKIDALQALVNELHATIAQLRGELAEARQRLTDTRLDALEADEKRKKGASLLNTLASVATIGGFGLASLAFFGVEAQDLGYEGLKKEAVCLAQEMAAVQHSPRPQKRREAAPEQAPRPTPRPEGR